MNQGNDSEEKNIPQGDSSTQFSISDVMGALDRLLKHPDGMPYDEVQDTDLDIITTHFSYNPSIGIELKVKISHAGRGPIPRAVFDNVLKSLRKELLSQIEMHTAAAAGTFFSQHQQHANNDGTPNLQEESPATAPPSSSYKG